VLRLHFEWADLRQVRVADRAAPLMELGLHVATVQRRQRDPDVSRWRASQRGRLAPDVAPLFALVPPSGAGPLFLDPLASSLDEGVDRVMRSPMDLVHDELRRVVPSARPSTTWVRDLDRRDPRAWRLLQQALQVGARDLLGDWDRVQRAWAAEAAWRARRLAHGGVETALADVFPGSHWDGPTLLAPWPHDADVHLGGAGLTLMPSAVWTGTPLFAVDDDGRTLLVHRALAPLPARADSGAGEDGDPLVALLGRTRAAVLRALVHPRTTTDLARELRVSPASASAHASVLRAAQLVTSRREGRTVRHQATALGVELAG
jgi:DNA-binding transcriptional ArsR family regulator